MTPIFYKNSSSSPAGLFGGLPALKSLIPPKSTEAEKASLILRLLRQAAVESRASRALPFYSIRAAATHFAVPPTTITRVYDQLKEEGVLASVWGSKTFVEPTRVDRNIRVKAIIGLPASLSAFTVSSNYRGFFVSLQDLLWKNGFGTRLIFYENNDAEALDLAEQLLSYKIDIVTWFAPTLLVSRAALRLADRGVRSISVFDELPLNEHGGYFLSRSQALTECLRNWKNDGVSSITVIRSPEGETANRMRLLDKSLTDARIPYSIQSVGTRSFLSSSFPAKNRWHGFVFSSSRSVLQLRDDDQRPSVRLMPGQRVLFLDGLIPPPCRIQSLQPTEVIEFEWRNLSREILCDLTGTRHLSPGARVVFQAKLCSADRSMESAAS